MHIIIIALNSTSQTWTASKFLSHLSWAGPGLELDHQAPSPIQEKIWEKVHLEFRDRPGLRGWVERDNSVKVIPYYETNNQELESIFMLTDLRIHGTQTTAGWICLPARTTERQAETSSVCQLSMILKHALETAGLDSFDFKS